MLVGDNEAGVGGGTFEPIATPFVKSGVEIDGFGGDARIGAGGGTIGAVGDELTRDDGAVDSEGMGIGFVVEVVCDAFAKGAAGDVAIKVVASNDFVLSDEDGIDSGDTAVDNDVFGIDEELRQVIEGSVEIVSILDVAGDSDVFGGMDDFDTASVDGGSRNSEVISVVIIINAVIFHFIVFVGEVDGAFGDGGISAIEISGGEGGIVIFDAFSSDRITKRAYFLTGGTGSVGKSEWTAVTDGDL